MKYKLYSCGSNGNYQLGLGHNEDVDILCHVPGISEQIVQIASGGNHTLVLGISGSVYAAGDNKYGQCGVPRTREGLKNFVKIPGGPWSSIACGWQYSVLVCNGQVFSCGLGSKGELGRGPLGNKLGLELGPVSIDEPVQHVYSSLDHVIAITSSKSSSVYGWGHNKCGKLGLHAERKIYSPVLLGEHAYDAALGREFTVLQSPQGAVVLGKLEGSGALVGHRSAAGNIKAMWSSVHVLSQQKVTLYGKNWHRQSLLKADTAADVIGSIIAFDTGSEHGLVLTKKGVFAWGWGEHGNCGRQQDSALTLLEFLEAEKGDEAYFVAGGCATTFVAVKNVS